MPSAMASNHDFVIVIHHHILCRHYLAYGCGAKNLSFPESPRNMRILGKDPVGRRCCRRGYPSLSLLMSLISGPDLESEFDILKFKNIDPFTALECFAGMMPFLFTNAVLLPSMLDVGV